MFNTENLRIAEIRNFDVEHMGLEFTNPVGYVLLLNRGDTYINVLNPGEIFPIYKRVPNTHNKAKLDDFYFGTKIESVVGDAQNGEAWLLVDNIDVKDGFSSDEVTLRQIEDFVLGSNLFFKDRTELAQARLKQKTSWLEELKLLGVVKADEAPLGAYKRFFEDRAHGVVYEKK